MKNSLVGQRILIIYSGMLTVVFAATLLTGFVQGNKPAAFKQLDVQRINIIEPDGTLRMVISSKALLPGIVIKGKETPHPNRKSAGLLFFNDEGTENGGLIFGGMNKDGTKVSSGHLSFDAYEQDQVLTIDSAQQGDKSSASFALMDRPAYSISEVLELSERIKNLLPNEQKAEVAKFSESHAPARQRLYLGRSSDKSVGLKLKDADGRDRLVIEVAADGSPVVRFLDEKGKLVNQLPPAAK